MAKQRTIVTNPPAELEKRDSDVPLRPEQFQKISLFATRMSKPPDLDKFPGTVALRYFRKGEVICRQGEAGWTAFYALTRSDLQSLPPELLPDSQTESPPAGGDELRQVATVYLALPRPPQPRQPGLLGWLFPSKAGKPTGPPPKFIPIDAPRDMAYESRQVKLVEGDLFGEMSCMHGSPRSATVVAAQDGFMLEMLRNILDQVVSDKKYQQEADRVYKERILQGHLRRLSIFSDLSDEDFRDVPDRVELLRLKAGEFICEEHDRSDSLYIIRSGLVKAVRGSSTLIGVAEVIDWPGLCAALCAAEQKPDAPARPLWDALGEPARQAARLGQGNTNLPIESRQAIAYGLNDFIKAPPLPDPKNTRQVMPASPDLDELRAALPPDGKRWSLADRRQFGRFFVEAGCPKVLRPWKKRAGQERVLAYQARGEVIGEIGLVQNIPRTATCVAYAHPDPGQGHSVSLPAARWRSSDPLVELVKVPKATFELLQQRSETVRRKVAQIAGQRQQATRQMESKAEWDVLGGTHSERFEELGLIQGQRLMLIDLDRCTRCDECVQACVNTHADGRSRLFLDGPRFGKYLVPTTCRACLDPVCMIGCPVGSIHRGDNREIIIENWCIGCGLCARNCPYGSIQMHDIGVVPEETHGWSCSPASALGNDAWVQARYAAVHWFPGRTPLHHGPELMAGLRALDAQYAGGPICFRYVFSVDRHLAPEEGRFLLGVTSTDGPLTVWLNGRELALGPAKRGQREATLSKETIPLQRGRNVLAVRATPTPRDNELLLRLRIDEELAPASPSGPDTVVSQKVVDELAVVCDLCSGSWGQRPACVTACPHDAAMRVDARTEFPEG